MYASLFSYYLVRLSARSYEQHRHIVADHNTQKILLKSSLRVPQFL